ncbi:MAG: hypothetical protein P0107_05360 [Nitrosomonas sp.]|nr:hypothetical protein [Nitrosomonas sp.]
MGVLRKNRKFTGQGRLVIWLATPDPLETAAILILPARIRFIFVRKEQGRSKAARRSLSCTVATGRGKTGRLRAAIDGIRTLLTQLPAAARDLLYKPDNTIEWALEAACDATRLAGVPRLLERCGAIPLNA